MIFDEFVETVTREHLVPTVIDTVLQSNPLTSMIMGDPIPWSGTKYKVPFKHAKSTTGGSYSGYDTFDTTRANTRDSMEFSPKAFYQSITMSNMERAVNMTSEQVLNLLAVELESAQQDMMDSIGTLMYGDGTGNDSKDFTGLAAAVDDGSVAAVYGGKDRSVFTTLQSSVTTGVGNLTLSAMATMYNDCSVGADTPDIIVTTEAIWSYYEELLQPTVVANYNAEGFGKIGAGKPMRRGALKGDIGFDALYFRGVPIVKDEHCTSGYMYFLNTRYLKWVALAHPDAQKASGAQGGAIEGYYSNGEDGMNSIPVFSWTGLKQPVNQDSIVGQFLVYGDLINKNPNRSGVLQGITGV